MITSIRTLANPTFAFSFRKPAVAAQPAPESDPVARDAREAAIFKIAIKQIEALQQSRDLDPVE